MDLVEIIKNCSSDEEIKKVIDKVIAEKTTISKEINLNSTFIGPDLGINPHPHIITDEKEITRQECNGFYCGFIPVGTKIIYGVMTKSDNMLQCTSGWYFYMNDVSYIYEFAKYIKGKKIKDAFDLANAVYRFLLSYFSNDFNPITRDSLHSLLFSGDFSYFLPSKEHTNSDFVGKGAAQCSEFSSAVCNILNVFGVQTVYVQSHVHAYDILCIPSDEEENVIDYYLFDTTSKVYSYEMGSDDYTAEAYLEFIPDFDDDELFKFFKGESIIKLPNYYIVHKDHYTVRMYTDAVRTYSIQTNYILKPPGDRSK